MTRRARSPSHSPHPPPSCSTDCPTCPSSAPRAWPIEHRSPAPPSARGRTCSARPPPATTTRTPSARATRGVPTAPAPTSRACPTRSSLRIVENPSTAANLLLTGDVNAAIVTGPDAQRLEQEDLFDDGDSRAARGDVVQPCRGTAHCRPGRAHGLDPGRRPRPAAAGAHRRPGIGGHDVRDARPGRLPG